MTLRDMLAERATLREQMTALHTAHPNGTLPETEQRQWDAWKGELDSVERRIERQSLLDETQRRMHGTPIAGGDNRWQELMAGYSLCRAILYADATVDTGREREASAEVERRTGRKPRGILIPDEVFRVRPIETRADPVGQVVGTQNLGGVLNPDRYRADLMTDRLRAASVLPRLGVQWLDDLRGQTVIPKLLTSGTVQWLDENEEPTESVATFGTIALTPHTVGAQMSYSRRTLINATPSIDALLRDDMARQIAAAIDAAAIGGDPTAKQPRGLLNYNGVGGVPELPAVAGGVLSIEGLIDLMAKPQIADAMTGGPAWLANMTTIAAAMKLTTTGSGDYILMGSLPNTLLGFPVVISSAVPSQSLVSETSTSTVLFYAAWSSMVVGRWSGVDVLADPFTRGSSGASRLYAFQDCDVGIRHIESFAEMPVTITW